MEKRKRGGGRVDGGEKRRANEYKDIRRRRKVGKEVTNVTLLGPKRINNQYSKYLFYLSCNTLSSCL